MHHGSVKELSEYDLETFYLAIKAMNSLNVKEREFGFYCISSFRAGVSWTPINKSLTSFFVRSQNGAVQLGVRGICVVVTPGTVALKVVEPASVAIQDSQPVVVARKEDNKGHDHLGPLVHAPVEVDNAARMQLHKTPAAVHGANDALREDAHRGVRAGAVGELKVHWGLTVGRANLHSVGREMFFAFEAVVKYCMVLWIPFGVANPVARLNAVANPVARLMHTIAALSFRVI